MGEEGRGEQGREEPKEELPSLPEAINPSGTDSTVACARGVYLLCLYDATTDEQTVYRGNPLVVGQKNPSLPLYDLEIPIPLHRAPSLSCGQ